MRLEAEVTLESGGVRECHRHVSRLHSYEFFMRFEIIICRKHSCAYQLLLKYIHKIQKILGIAVSYIIHGIWS